MRATIAHLIFEARPSLRCGRLWLKGMRLMLRQDTPSNSHLAIGTGNDYNFVELSTRAKD
jgi:hypothetical protein